MLWHEAQINSVLHLLHEQMQLVTEELPSEPLARAFCEFAAQVSNHEVREGRVEGIAWGRKLGSSWVNSCTSAFFPLQHLAQNSQWAKFFSAVLAECISQEKVQVLSTYLHLEQVWRHGCHTCSMYLGECTSLWGWLRLTFTLTLALLAHFLHWHSTVWLQFVQHASPTLKFTLTSNHCIKQIAANTDCVSFRGYGCASMCQLWQIKLAKELTCGQGKRQEHALLHKEYLESLILRLKNISRRKDKG